MDGTGGDSLASTPESVKATAQSIGPLGTSSDEVTSPTPCPGEGVDFLVGESITRAVQGRPYERSVGQPIYRPLKIFALDPSVSRLEGATALINVPYEPLEKGPSGSIFVVADEDGENVDLDLEDPNILIRNGIDPATSEKRFQNQMVYAVCSTVYTAFRTALGRHITWGFKNTNDRVQLRLRPRAFEGTNSFYDKDAGELCFGYYKNKAAAGFPEMVYASLSHDTLAHETTHALLDGLRAHFSLPTSADVPAFHEGFADIVAVFQHFSYEQVVRAAIRKSRGDLSRAELLSDIARQLGQTSSEAKSALRTAIDDAEKYKEAKDSGSQSGPKLYDPTLESHELGSVLLAAVFEAFITVFRRKTERLVRLATRGSGRLPPGELPADLQAALAEKASKLASQFLTMSVRAIDYCPTVDITFGEFLRAVITADKDLVPDDPWAYREAWIDAFRRRHIYPSQVDDLSEDSLLWRGPQNRTPPLEIESIQGLSFAELRFSGDPGWPVDAEELRRQACALGQIVTRPEYLNFFGLAKKKDPDLNGDDIVLPKVQSVRSSRRIGPSGQVVFDVVAEVTQRRLARIEGSEDLMNFFGGSTVIIDPDGNIRYVMAKRVTNNDRLNEQKAFLESPEGARYKDSLWGKATTKPNVFAMLHDEPPVEAKTHADSATCICFALTSMKKGRTDEPDAD